MDRWKSRGGKRREEERRFERRKNVKKEDAGVQKGRKVTIHCVFPMICGSGGSKSRLAKAAGAEPGGQMRDENLHAVVERRTFPIFGTFLEVDMSKMCTPLWHEAHFQVKMYKAHQGRTNFGSWDVGKVHADVARSTFPSQKAKKLRGSDHFWRLGCRFAWQAQWIAPGQKWAKREGFVAVSTTTTSTVQYATLHCTTLHSTTLHSITVRYNYSNCYNNINNNSSNNNSNSNSNYPTLHYTHYTTLHYNTLRYTTTISRARASRVAEVSRFTKCTALGSKNKFCL